ncbi:MAG: D-alanyl-D-alanine carboxypeptidase, partial [Bacilli bacterium]|nr:D-alanyl-D-alanine carboxypeptidase [Bacilli bacterium]
TYLRENTNNKFWLVNTNKLVRFYKGVDGLKTGYTDKAGYCLTATIEKDNMRLIAVAMGEPTSNIRNAEVTAMLDYGFNLYKNEIYVSSKEILGSKDVELGKDRFANIVVAKDVSSINKKGHKVGNITYDLNVKKLKAPVYRGQKVGTLTIKEDGKELTTVDVTVDKSIKKAGIFEIYYRYLKDILSFNL